MYNSYKLVRSQNNYFKNPPGIVGVEICQECANQSKYKLQKHLRNKIEVFKYIIVFFFFTLKKLLPGWSSEAP